jgi:soluble lytic murein transglycosylase-like protein
MWKKYFNTLVFLLLVFTPNVASAKTMLDDFISAGKHYNIAPQLLIAIAKTETSLNPWAVNVQGKGYFPKTKEEALRIAGKAYNERKSFDIGIMQINVWWLRKYGISLETAIEPQNNIIIGAFILKNEINRHGLNWKAVASYHTPVHRNPTRGKYYAAKVVKNLKGK